MRLRSIFTLAFLLLVTVSCSREEPAHLVTDSSTVQNSYREKCNDLIRYLGDIREQVRQNNGVKAHALLRSLVIPKAPSWFIRTFGPTLGPQLNLEYEAQMGWRFGRLEDVIWSAAHCDKCRLSCEVSGRAGAAPFFRNVENVFRYAQVPMQVYFVSLSPEEADWVRVVGHFVYIDGGFRYLGYLEVSPHWSSFLTIFGRRFTSDNPNR